MGEFILMSLDVLVCFSGESGGGGIADDCVFVLERAYGLVMTESWEALMFIW